MPTVTLTTVAVGTVARRAPPGLKPGGTLRRMPFPRFGRSRTAKEPLVAVDDPRLAGWETVTSFEDRDTAIAWRDQLRAMGIDASCVADHAPDRFGRGDIYLVVPPAQWSRANEIVENLD